MNLVARLRHHLVTAGIVSAAQESALMITLTIGDIPRHPLRLTRRYVVSGPDGLTFSVKFIPQPWGFDVAHIVKTHAQYARCTSFRVPRLTAHFAVSEGCFFVEENLGPAPTLAQLVEQGTVSVDAAAAVIRSILAEIWESGRKPTEAFVRQEKARYRGYLLRFVEAGLLADVTAGCLDRLVDDHCSALRRVWSSGDIVDRNILRVGDSWVVVDFEYAHETLFFFKEAFRSILNSAWARDLSLVDVCSFLGEFPEPAARLFSLLWERQLRSLVLDAQAEAETHTILRDRFWHVLDAELVGRNDQRLSALQQERQQLRDNLHAQHEQLLRHAVEAEQWHTEERRLTEENAHLRRAASEGTDHARRLEGEGNRLQSERDHLQVHVHTLAAEGDRRQRELDALQVHARALAAELDRLREVDGRAHDLETEVMSVRNDAREAWNQVHGLEVIVASTKAGLEWERQAVRHSTRALAEREQTLANVLNSRSWRVTRSLRWMFDRLGGGGKPSPGQSVAGLTSPAERHASPVRYHVEAFHIEGGDQPGTSVLRLRGWCFAPSGREPVVLDVQSRERTLERIVCDLARDDVAAAHPEDAAASSLPRCGFDTTVAVEHGFTRLVLWIPAYATTLATLLADHAGGAQSSSKGRLVPTRPPPVFR